MWPAVAVASAAVIYWVWLDNPTSPGLVVEIASTVFIAVFFVAAFCTLNHFGGLIGLIGRLRAPATHIEERAHPIDEVRSLGRSGYDALR